MKLQGWADNARNWWRWGSSRVLFVIAAIPPVWTELPPEVKDYVPEEYRVWVFTVLALVGLLLRVTKWGTPS